MNAAGQPDRERMRQAQDGFRQEMDAYMQRRIAEEPELLDRPYQADEEQEHVKRYLERMSRPNAVGDQWAFCRHHDGTPDFHPHVVPNPMPSEDRPLALARFQITAETTEWPAADGGTILFCPCLTCRIEAERRIRGGGQ